MRSTLLLAATFYLLLQTIQAQDRSDVYKYFDAAWKPVKEKKATYLQRIRFTKDSCWQYSYYNVIGPLIRIETFLDERATIRHGLFAWYNEEGILDSSGYYDHGLPDKDWIHPSLKGKTQRDQYYEKGKLLTEEECRKKLKSEEIVDPSFPNLSRPTPESYFPGGEAGWLEYLQANVHYPKRAIDRFVRGDVVVLFIVEPTGKLKDITICQSIEISLDDEAIRLIDNSPSWIPAIRFERKVRSYKKQPIGFKLQFSN